MVINKAPEDFSSAHGDLYYNVFDAKANDPATYVDYKYVLDVYIGGILVASQKAAPHPLDKKGIFNIGSIVRNYVGIKNLVFNGFNPDCIWMNNGTFYAEVQVKVGEEYGDTLTTNILTDSSRRFYNTYNGRLLGKATILPDYLTKFGTTRPLDGNQTRRDAKHFFIPYLSRVEDWTHYQFKNNTGYTFDGQFYSGGANWLMQLDISSRVFNILANSVGAVGVSHDTEWYEFQVDFGPKIRIYLYDECIDTPRVIHFVNRFGGLETFDFRKKSIKRLEIESKGIGVLRADNSGSTYNGEVVNDNYKAYATRYNEKLTLNSGNVREGHYKWLAEMVLSPQKWIEEEGMLVPVTFTNTNYEFKTAVNNRADNVLTVEVNFNDVLNTQYL